MRYNKKGQAAMEFLMTYGWAILAAVVVIGALAYFGVFSPGQYAPKTCTLNAPLWCDEHNMDENGVNLVIRNGGGKDITLQSVEVTECGTVTSGNFTDGDQLNDGDTKVVNVNCDLSGQEEFSGDLTVTYMNVGGELNQTTSGQVVGTVA